MRELAVTSDGAGNIRELTAPWSKCDPAGSADKVCKHLARHAPTLGQPFCGQSGQDLPDLSDDVWQGISSIDAEAADTIPDAAEADVTGTTNIAPNMATMPRTRNQRWNRSFFKGLALHSSLDNLIIAELLLPANEFDVMRQRLRLSVRITSKTMNGTAPHQPELPLC